MCPRAPAATPTVHDFSATFIYTDGACSGNPGPGGWGAIVLTPDHRVVELGGRVLETTNNRMELQGPISALSQLPPELSAVEILTDSTYVIRGITQWVWGWMKRGWVTAEGKEVLNQDLWKRLFELTRTRKIRWHYVRGHTGNPGNERVDEISVVFSKGQRPSLYQGSVNGYDVSLLPLPEDTELPAAKPAAEAAPAKPHSYLSLIGTVAERHSSWKSCEARVKGQSGARFRKAMSEKEEREILSSWGIDPARVKLSGGG